MAAGDDIANTELDEITATQLAVDRQIEQRSIAEAFRASKLAPGDGTALRAVLELLDAKVTIEQQNLRLELDRASLAEALRIGGLQTSLTEPIVIDSPVALKRRGIELRLVYTAPEAQPASKDQKLIDLIRRGWAAWQQLLTAPRSSNPVERSHLVRLARLRFLAPDITAAILEGRQPVELTARSLLRCSDLPVSWDDQRRALGFN